MTNATIKQASVIVDDFNENFPEEEAQKEDKKPSLKERINEARIATCRTIVDVNQEIRLSRAEVDDFKDSLKTAKESLGHWQDRLSSLANELEEIDRGQLPLFSANPEANNDIDPIDPAFQCEIACLGMSTKENGLLEAAGIKSVSDLEKQMRENEWWHRDIKGFGQSKVDKLSDALIAWRMNNSIPHPDDDNEDPESLSLFA